MEKRTFIEELEKAWLEEEKIEKFSELLRRRNKENSFREIVNFYAGLIIGSLLTLASFMVGVK